MLSEFVSVWTPLNYISVFCCLLCQQNEFEERATKKVDDLLESYMGIRDLELGKTTHINTCVLKNRLLITLQSTFGCKQVTYTS